MAQNGCSWLLRSWQEASLKEIRLDGSCISGVSVCAFERCVRQDRHYSHWRAKLSGEMFLGNFIDRRCNNNNNNFRAGLKPIHNSATSSNLFEEQLPKPARNPLESLARYQSTQSASDRWIDSFRRRRCRMDDAMQCSAADGRLCVATSGSAGLSAAYTVMISIGIRRRGRRR